MTKINKIGYARVSSAGQKLDSQIDELTKAGCTKIFSEKISGVKESRNEWQKLIEYLRSGDTLIVTELSRMTRSLIHLLEVVKQLEEKEINIISLRENIDTTSATGRFFISVIGAISQMERELKSERAASGREAAKARGKTGGRPRTPLDKLEQAKILYENSDKTAMEICKTFGFGRRTLFNYLANQKKKL
jgi:DNA invertase Pin-like site-specific DNA recombinase